MSKNKFQTIALDEIDEPKAPTRTSIDENALTELARSIQQVGVLEPILVRQNNGRYEIIAGHRRYLASRLARIATIPAIVTQLDANQSMQGQLHENLFRSNPSDDEYAMLFKALTEKSGWSMEQIAHATGKGESFVRSRMQILNFPTELREALKDEKISLSAARELSAIDDDDELKRLLHYAVTNGITTRTAMAWRQAYESTREPVDVSTVKPTSTEYGTRTGPPMYPCFGCQRPEDLIALTVVRFCRNCLEAITTQSNSVNEPQG